MLRSPRALIIGINGQDGIFLSQVLRNSGYTVFGVGNSPSVNENVSEGVLYNQCDIRDTSKLLDLIIENEIYEIYNLAAVSSVNQSFLNPSLTFEVNYYAVKRLLGGVFSSSFKDHFLIRFFQASSSEMFGITLVEPQNENLGFNPVSPYGTSKVMALESCRQYRENGFYVSSAIMYNHESIHRPTQYVTRKISRTVAAIANGQADKLSIGNLQVQRDWGYASDYMQAAFLMLQQKVPNDYIIATGIVHSVQDLISMAFAEVGLGGRESEFLLIDEGLMRPREISRLIGDSSKARIDLGWEPTKPFAEVFRHMVLHDLSLLGN